MSVVCVSVKNIRPKYKDLSDWINDPNNVYIGRAGIVFINKERFPKQSSIWANPYKINFTNSRDDVLILYKTYITKKIIEENLYDELKKLKGKNLGCWCHPNKCHGDILLELIHEFL